MAKDQLFIEKPATQSVLNPLPVQILTAEFWPCFPGGSPIEKHGVECQSTQPN